ncbi:MULTISPECIES: TIGR01777 family oxidoreductase [unclassified Spirosoma]|uniref:TIGR01777 family oxidoreductase n=1 Tax=unclassified Spirosoma TaxID=2621999 RepID=UPI00095A23BF|nr:MULTISPECIES: TIGR01777 family oxidoreductase [unclassified Spirosoma]MBN8822712.1 TIGR01777 family oxidoreductase [Spirosoma sp.]OJW79925.1 MAG: TIGR01777 family protein [Spirosoma sp. 48-14]
MQQTVLITGGTGTIGRRLTQLLQAQGYQVALLSHSAKTLPGLKVYQWDIEKGEIALEAIQTADHIVHLAGEGIADGRWTDSRKEKILNSRTQSTDLLAKVLAENDHHVKSFIGASAIGFYGGDTSDRPLTETSEGGSDFLAQVVRAWERSEMQIASLGIRTVLLRTGVVLTADGGALPKIAQPIRLGAGAPIGSGQQYIAWIHLDDMCRMYTQALTDTTWQGIYNAVAPNPVTNETLTKAIADVLHRPLILPNIPEFTIKLLYGEMAIVVTGGNYVLNKRIADETTFTYQYADLKTALEDLLT